jgi:hypothetical protein
MNRDRCVLAHRRKTPCKISVVVFFPEITLPPSDRPARNRRGGLPTLILVFCRLRLEASSANATTPHRRNLRANDLHLTTAARRTFRLMTHDLLATFVYVTEHYRLRDVVGLADQLRAYIHDRDNQPRQDEKCEDGLQHTRPRHSDGLRGRAWVTIKN